MFRVVLVQPHYSGNVGSITRLMANFDIDDLVLVSPIADHLNDEARKYAVNAQDILESARVVPSLEEPVKGSAIVAATTDQASAKKVRRTPITPKEFAEKVAAYWNTDDVVSIVFGREPSGLTNEELEMADYTITIPTSRKYPAMNLSHAVAVILYELYTKRSTENVEPPTAQTYETADRIFSELVDAIGRKNPLETKKSWKAVIRRGAKTDKELRAIIGVLAEALRRAVKNGREG